jgi:hypothetical protein
MRTVLRIEVFGKTIGSFPPCACEKKKKKINIIFPSLTMCFLTYRSSNFFLISSLAFLVFFGSLSESLLTMVLSSGTSTEYLNRKKKH